MRTRFSTSNGPTSDERTAPRLTTRDLLLTVRLVTSFIRCSSIFSTSMSAVIGRVDGVLPHAQCTAALLTPRISHEFIPRQRAEHRGSHCRPSFTLCFSCRYIVYLWVVFLRWEYQYYEAPRGSRKRNNHVRNPLLLHLSRGTNLWIHCRELAITPPIISFSSIRSFDWGPVTIPIEVGGTVQFRNSKLLILNPRLQCGSCLTTIRD